MGYFFKALEKMGSAKKGDTPRSEEESGAPMKRQGGAPLVALSDSWSYSSEQFRAIKTSIMFPENGRELRTILVTSAVPREGKSFIVSNIAAAIASSIDNYALVIDSDLRRPTMADIFSLPSGGPGLGLYLNNQCSLEAAIYRTYIDKLSVIPAGPVVNNPSELITSSTMARMLADVRSRYSDRYVIIDSPPPLFAPEATVISKHVDGIIVVVRNDKTLKKSVAKMLDKLDRSKVIGIVLNRYTPYLGGDYGYKNYYSNNRGSRRGSRPF